MATQIGTHLTSRRVALHDVLEHLASETMVSSAFGAQLERARDGTTGGGDWAMARGAAEERLLAQAAVIRCVDALKMMTCLNRTGEACVDVRRFAVRVGLPEGAAVIAVLRAYQPWATSSGERGLVAVYEWMRALNGNLPALDIGKETSAAQAFRTGRCKRARLLAAGILADAEVAVHAWVEAWNGGGRRATRAAA